MKINHKVAEVLLREEAGNLDLLPPDHRWERKVEQLSQFCEQGEVRTHIAFFGTVLLAKAVNLSADLIAIKPDHAPDNPRAFSARSLCHGVLVPLAAELNFSLGVSGREPLNNQPYFRMTRLDDGTPVHPSGRAAFDFMMSLVQELQGVDSSEQARAALRSFIAVRRRYQPRYAEMLEGSTIAPEELASWVQEFVSANSEGGKRAQAVVAGLLDVFAGAARVESGRINDPSRHYPGDVCVESVAGDGAVEKAIEVRDKPVRSSDVMLFVNKCIVMGVREAALVMASDQQTRLNNEELSTRAYERGLGLTLFYGWLTFVDQALFWAAKPKPVAAKEAAQFIYSRLVAVEASPDAVASWVARFNTNAS